MHTLQIVSTDNEMETAWIANTLKFKSERFIDVMKKIADWYGVKVICRCPAIENDLISGSFKGEKLEAALNAFKITYHFDYEIHGDTILIK